VLQGIQGASSPGWLHHPILHISRLQFHNGGKKEQKNKRTHLHTHTEKNGRKMRKEISNRRRKMEGGGRCPKGAAALIGCRLEWPQWHWVSVNGNRREALGQVLGKSTPKAETSF